jgi:hypothetical protein
MPIEYTECQAVLSDVVSVEDAEALFGWLQGRRATSVNLSDCNHLHPAALQVLMAAGVHVTAWPEEANLRAWLETALKKD